MTHSFPTRRASDLSKQAKRRERGEAIDSGPNVPRPEVTSTCQTYIDLHRHAAVRAALTGHPKVALRLMVAHAITGSYLWRVKPEPQTFRNEAARESVETCRAEAEFDAKRSEEHTSELQSLMPISYAVFCLKTKTKNQTPKTQTTII